MADTKPLPLLGKEIIVIGAGPTGITTALMAQQLGAKVTIFEKRAKESWGTRHRAVSVDRTSIELFKDLGIDIPVTPFMGVVDFRNLDGTKKSIPASAFHHFSKEVFGREYSGIISIKEIERRLAKEFILRGGEIKYDQSVTHLSRATEFEKASIVSSGEDKKTIRFEADFLISADGSHSDTLKLLDLEKVKFGQSNLSPYHSAVFESNDLPKGQFRYASLDLDGVRVFAMYLTGEEIHTLYLNSDNPDFKPDREQIQFIAKQIGITGQLIEDPRSFEIELKKSPFFMENNIVILGDAARNTDPMTGFGVSNGLLDVGRLKKFFIGLSNLNNSYETLHREFVNSMEKSVRSVSIQVWTYKAVQRLLLRFPFYIDNEGRKKEKMPWSVWKNL